MSRGDAEAPPAARGGPSRARRPSARSCSLMPNSYSGDPCSTDNAGATATTAADKDIPANLLRSISRSATSTTCPGRSSPASVKKNATRPATRILRAIRSPELRGRESRTAQEPRGPMQIGIGGMAGDEYDQLRHVLTDPQLGPLGTRPTRSAKRPLPAPRLRKHFARMRSSRLGVCGGFWALL